MNLFIDLGVGGGALRGYGSPFTIDVDGKGADAGQAGISTWVNLWFGDATVAGAGLNYMEWVTGSNSAFLFGLAPHSSYLLTGVEYHYPANPNGEPIYGAQNSFGFQGPNQWVSGISASISNFGAGAGDVIGMLVDWSTLAVTMTLNGSALCTFSLPGTAFDPYFTTNCTSKGATAVFRCNLLPAEWVYPQTGASEFPQTIA